MNTQFSTQPIPTRPRRNWWPAVITGAVCLGVGLLIGSAGQSNSNAANGSPAPTVTVTAPGTTSSAAPAPTVTVTKTVTKTVTRTPQQAGATMPGDGTFVVGTASGDWAPGTWQSAGTTSNDCYWATLADLSGGLNSIIANNNTSGQSVMTVPANAKGVQVSGCDPWHKIG